MTLFESCLFISSPEPSRWWSPFPKPSITSVIDEWIVGIFRSVREYKSPLCPIRLVLLCSSMRGVFFFSFRNKQKRPCFYNWFRDFRPIINRWRIRDLAVRYPNRFNGCYHYCYDCCYYCYYFKTEKKIMHGIKAKSCHHARNRGEIRKPVERPSFIDWLISCKRSTINV